MRSTEPSLTALGVAAARSRLDRLAAPTGDPGADDALTASLLTEAGERARDRAERDDDDARDFVRALGVRTAFFDAAVMRAVAGDVHQVVILGAGYDGRALRFRSAGVRFFEVDHPATQADKRRRLDTLGIRTDDIAFVRADFTEPGLDAALAEAGHRPDVRTLFLLEGVLRYLPEPSVRDLLRVVATVAAPGSELAVSISTTPPTEPADVAERRQAQERRLAASGEPVLTVPDRAVALQWLADAGWTVGSVDDIADVEPGTTPGRLLVLAHV